MCKGALLYVLATRILSIADPCCGRGCILDPKPFSFQATRSTKNAWFMNVLFFTFFSPRLSSLRPKTPMTAKNHPNPSQPIHIHLVESCYGRGYTFWSGPFSFQPTHSIVYTQSRNVFFARISPPNCPLPVKNLNNTEGKIPTHRHPKPSNCIYPQYVAVLHVFTMKRFNAVYMFCVTRAQHPIPKIYSSG